MTTAAELKPRDECLYYLVREMGDLGCRAKDQYLDDALEHVRRDHFDGMNAIEIQALAMAAEERGRLSELRTIALAREERLQSGNRS